MDDHAAGWDEIGVRIRAAREAKRPKLSGRAAARAAPMSSTWWQDLERGRARVSDEKLEAAARVVGLNPEPLFALIDRVYEPSDPPAPTGASERLDALEAAVSEMRSELQTLLGRNGPPPPAPAP